MNTPHQPQPAPTINNSAALNCWMRTEAPERPAGWINDSLSLVDEFIEELRKSEYEEKGARS